MTVGARKLVDILRALPDGAEVTLQQQDKRLLVKAGKSRFTLQTLPAEDFPRLAKPGGRGRPLHAVAEGIAPAVRPGAVRHGAAGHPLLPERPADGGRGQDPEADRHRRPSPGLRRHGARGQAAAPGSDPAAQDGARTRQAARRQRRRGEGRDFRNPGLASRSAASSWFRSSSTASFPITRASFRSGTRTSSRSGAKRCASRCSARRSCRTRSSAACAGC